MNPPAAKSALNRFFTTTPDRVEARRRLRSPGRFAAPELVVEDMNRAVAWTIAGVSRRTRDAAVEAARRSGMGLDDWLDEAIAGHAGLDPRAEPSDDEALDDRLDAAAHRLERIARGQAPAEAPRAPQIPGALDSVIERFGMRLGRAEAQAARAFESVAQILERDTAARDGDRRALIEAVRGLQSIRAGLRASASAGEARGGGHAPAPAPDGKAPFDLKAAVSQIAMRRHELEASAGRGAPGPAPGDQPTVVSGASWPAGANAQPPVARLLLDDVRALSAKLDAMRRERTQETDQAKAQASVSAVDLGAMRAEIDAMRRSLADLAPRNAVVALEGAIRDLVERVEMLRQSGQAESMLAPLEAMAAEFRAALKAHDPQAAAAGLEREIRAIGGKIDSLGARAIDPETFERIRRQTEEARGLLASAALRTAPLERLERQVGELADRVERLGASPVPHFESAEMAALLAEACRQIERSTPPAALASIEKRLEEIATRLDQEIARPSASVAIDPEPFEDLARRIDSVQRSLETLPPATVDMRPIEKLLREFDAGSRIKAGLAPVDLNPVETLIRSLEAKFEASANAPVDREVVEQVADAVARRLDDAGARQAGLDAVAHRVETINDRIDRLAAKATASDPGPVLRELIEKLREAEKAESASALETSAAVHAALDAHLSELRAEQASADNRTQSRFSDLQRVLETLTARLASIETELAAEDVDEALRPPARPARLAPSMNATAPGEAKGPEATSGRGAQPGAPAARSQIADSEDVLIEPGAGAPERAGEAREPAPAISPRTSPAVSVHIAAARRAAQAAVAETGAAPMSGGVRILTGAERAPFAARGVETARAFYASHKRTVLFCVAIAVAATLAVRMAGVRAPFLQRSELDGQAVNTARTDASKDMPADHAGGARPGGKAIDVSPTGSIAEPPVKPDAPDLAPEGRPSASALPLAIPPEIPSSLRDAVAAGEPNAQYELATRLVDGRGLPKDQTAAARWFERAAQAGLAPAQYRLGAMYEKGIGVSRNPAAAKSWYLRAAEAGNARAAHNLAVMAADPGSGEANYLQAAKWFRKAAEFGVRDSQYNLAILYARGLGVEKDLGQSFLWFSLAAQGGDQDAARKRDEIAGQMDPASLASAVGALMKFKPIKPDPAANEVAAPAGGWNAMPGSLGQSPADVARP